LGRAAVTGTEPAWRLRVPPCARTARPEADTYIQRRREESVLRRVVRDQLPRLRAEAEDVESGTSRLPKLVVDELEEYIACGDPARGFVRAFCESCHESFLVGFTCRASICASCSARRMEDGARQILEHVLPADAPIRQVVHSLPFALRPMVGYDAELFAALTRMFMSEVFRALRKKGRRVGVEHPLCAGIAVLQRAGNAIDLNPHIHAIAVDGVFRDRAPPGAAEPDLELVPVDPPDEGELTTISRRVCTRFLDLLRRRGLADADTLCPPETPPPMGLVVETAARVSTRFAQVDEEGNVWAVEERIMAGGRFQAGAYRGFSTEAGVAATGDDQAKRERIVRYVLKPPLAEAQVTKTRDGRIAIRLHRPRRSGATHVVMDEMGLLRKIAALVEPPGLHRVRYFGCLSSASKHRSFVVPPPRLELGLSTGSAVVMPAASLSPSLPTRRTPWLALLARVYGTDSTRCPACKTGRLRVVGAIMDAEIIEKILAHLEKRERARAEAEAAKHDATLPGP